MNGPWFAHASARRDGRPKQNHLFPQTLLELLPKHFLGSFAWSIQRRMCAVGRRSKQAGSRGRASHWRTVDAFGVVGRQPPPSPRLPAPPPASFPKLRLPSFGLAVTSGKKWLLSGSLGKAKWQKKKQAPQWPHVRISRGAANDSNG